MFVVNLLVKIYSVVKMLEVGTVTKVFFLKSTFFIYGDLKMGMGWWKRNNARREVQWSEHTLFHLLLRREFC